MPRTNQARRTEEKIGYYQTLMNKISDNRGNAHKESIGKLIELMQRRVSDLDNNLGAYTQKEYAGLLKAQLKEVVSTYEDLEKEYGKGMVPEEAGMPPQVIEGIRFMINGLGKDWGPEELGVLAFLGETKAQIEKNKDILSEDEFKRKYQKTGRELSDLITKCTLDPAEDRNEKIRFAEEIYEFASMHETDGSLYDQSRLRVHFAEDSQPEANDIVDPYNMRGFTRADQMENIMEDLDAVDGTFQHSSPNFRELRKRLEELNALARKHPDEMTREELDEYLAKADEVKAAAKKYLDGKNAEIRQYRRNHDNEDPVLKDITKKRMNFAMELEDRINLHLNHSEKVFEEDTSLDPKAHSLALLARRMREEVNYRKKNLPAKPIDAENLFLQSVYRSMYLESLRARYLTEADFNERGLEYSLDKEKIEIGAETIKSYFKHYNLERNLIKNINDKIRLNNTDYGREFIDSEIHRGMEKLNRTEEDPLFTAKDEIMNTFAYRNVDEDEYDEEIEDGKTGFGRYLSYFDRDENGYSEIEYLERKLGITKSEEERLRDLGEEAEADKEAVLTESNRQLVYLELPSEQITEEAAGKYVSRYMMNLYYDNKKNNGEIMFDGDADESFEGDADEKAELLKNAVDKMVKYMDLSGMTGSELQSFLLAGARNGMIEEMEKNAEAYVEATLAQKNHLQVSKETAERAKDYTDLIRQGEKNKAEEEAEEKFFKQPGLVVLKTDWIPDSEGSFELSVGDLLKKEEKIRRKLIDEIKKDREIINNDQKKEFENINNVVDEKDVDKMKEALVSSACRTLFIEMLKEKYVEKEEYYDNGELRTATKQINEKKFRQALSLGMKDKTNMQEFTDLMKTSFGKKFTANLEEMIQKNGELSNQDILKARDKALTEDFMEAFPSYFSQEAFNKGEKKDDRVKMEELRNLTYKLGSHCMDKIKNEDFGLTREERGKIRKWSFNTDFTKQAEKHNAPVVNGPKF